MFAEHDLMEARKGPFPEHIVETLESYYQRGMIGWGKMHIGAFTEALHITGLTANQLKVRSQCDTTVL